MWIVSPPRRSASIVGGIISSCPKHRTRSSLDDGGTLLIRQLVLSNLPNVDIYQLLTLALGHGSVYMHYNEHEAKIALNSISTHNDEDGPTTS